MQSVKTVWWAQAGADDYICGSDIRFYARKHLFFLFKYIEQYSASYWNSRRTTILTRLNSNIIPRVDYFSVRELIAIDNLIKRESLSIFANRSLESSRTHRVMTYGQSPKVTACSEWTYEFLFQSKNAKRNRQELANSLTVEQLCQAYAAR